MSPTVLRKDAYHVVIFANDHPPAHVHVRAAGNVARVQLEPLRLMDAYGYTGRQLRAIMNLVSDNLELCLAKWDELHPEGR
jgi:hypothetical protein